MDLCTDTGYMCAAGQTIVNMDPSIFIRGDYLDVIAMYGGRPMVTY